ncbi:hypothetical protein BLL69_0447c [Lacticaseibacillus paracasei]|nr:hypothetical protein BLL69_0447c [Lacticaseibacillus paracasei]
MLEKEEAQLLEQVIEVAKNYSIKKKVEVIFMLGRLCQKALF